MKQTDICTSPFKHLTRSYDYADKFDVEHQLSSGTLSERQIETFRHQGAIAALTPDTFRLAYARRRGDTDPVPYGFTRAALEGMGFTLRPDSGAPAPKAKAVPPPPKPKAEPTPVEELRTIEFNDNAIDYRGFKIQPKKNGKFNYYDAADLTGRLLRPAAFKKLESAEAFIDGIVGTSAASTPAPAADKPETDAEQTDDGDLQSSADGQREPGAPAAG
jgi:hypothetical protein